MDTVIRAIENYRRYFVSADGRVFRELKGNVKDNGYIYVKLSKGSRYEGQHTGERQQKMHFVHRLVAETWIGPDPGGCDVDHGDGVRSNNHVGNLEWCTRAENLARARRNGRAAKAGEKNPHAKLTKDEVLLIRACAYAGESNVSIAKTFDVSSSLVSMIVNRKIWTHI